MKCKLDTIEENCLNINEKRKKLIKYDKRRRTRKDKHSNQIVSDTCKRTEKSQVFINSRNSEREMERSNQWIFRQHN